MKNIYITWHYTTHGVAYYKHILSEFYRQGLPNKNISFDNLNQEELNTVFDNPTENGFLFDEIIYLTAPQAAFDKLSTRRFNYTRNVLQDPEVIRVGLTDIYEQIINENTVFDQMEKELEFVANKYPDKLHNFKSTIWRNIQHYPIEQQIKWLNEMSNFKNIYQNRFAETHLNVSDLRNEKEIADKVSEWAKRYFAKQKPDTRVFINVSLGSSETQVVWHILAEAGLFPKNTHFLKTYDDKTKNSENERFKLFSIKEIPVKLISDIGDSFKIFPETKSKHRALANMKMITFLKTGFSILLIGERGIGKTQIAREASKNNDRFITANCASFADDTMAESELFGYDKGAFTGALKEGKSGLFADANGGILFLDEIHNLSKSVQAKLMTAIQTDKENNMHIRKFGSNKTTPIKCRLIFATNKTIKELRECLLPDFYDRIVQHIIEIPPLRETVKDREEDWTNTWKQLRFETNPPNEPELIEWLKKLKLYGNFRDLQKIAMYYNAFNQFDSATKALIEEQSPFEYAKNTFTKYHSQIPQNEKGILIKTASDVLAKDFDMDFHYKLGEWARENFGSRKEAAIKLNVSEKTLDNWKNRK